MQPFWTAFIRYLGQQLYHCHFFADCMSNADINQGAFSSGKSALMMNLDGLMLSISVRQKTLKFHKHLNINVVMALLHGVAYFEAR